MVHGSWIAGLTQGWSPGAATEQDGQCGTIHGADCSACLCMGSTWLVCAANAQESHTALLPHTFHCLAIAARWHEAGHAGAVCRSNMTRRWAVMLTLQQSIRQHAASHISEPEFYSHFSCLLLRPRSQVRAAHDFC